MHAGRRRGKIRGRRKIYFHEMLLLSPSPFLLLHNVNNPMLAIVTIIYSQHSKVKWWPFHTII